jgi:hypothetical protein
LIRIQFSVRPAANDFGNPVHLSGCPRPSGRRKAEVGGTIDGIAPPSEDDLREEEFAAELDRRFAEIEKDPTSGIPWTEIKRGQ